MSFTPPPTVKTGGRVIPANVIGSVRKASSATGVNFAYLMAQAARESSFRAEVSSTQSSASGLFQFVQGTWLQMMKKHGAKYGYGALAEKIHLKSGGGYTVDDPKTLSDILALRQDAELSSLMAAEYARNNKQYLEKAIGREIAPADLYIAHFLGPAGAARLLKARGENAAQVAATLLPAAAKNNKSIFYYESGQPRSVAALYEHLESHVEEPIRLYTALQNETGAVRDPLAQGNSPSLGTLLATATNATAKSRPQATQTAVAILAVLETSARSTPGIPPNAIGALETLQNHLEPGTIAPASSLMATLDDASQKTQQVTQNAEKFAARTVTALAEQLEPKEKPATPTQPAPSLMAALDSASQKTQQVTQKAENFAARTVTALAEQLESKEKPATPTQPAPSLMAALDNASQKTQQATQNAEKFATRTVTALAEQLEPKEKPATPTQPAPSLMAALDSASQKTQQATQNAEKFAARTVTALAEQLEPKEKPATPTQPTTSLMAALDSASQKTQQATQNAEKFAARTVTALAEQLEPKEKPATPIQSAPSLMAALDDASLPSSDMILEEDPILSLIASASSAPTMAASEKVAQAYAPLPESAASYRDKLLLSGAIPATALTPPAQPTVQPLPPKIIVAARNDGKGQTTSASAAENFEKLAKSLQG